MVHLRPITGPDCSHPDWAMERTVAGNLVCRICNPKPKHGDRGFL